MFTTTTNVKSSPSTTLFDQLPSEIFEHLFSFVPFKQSYNFSISSHQLSTAFLNHFRRVLREHLSNYNNYLIEKFEIITSTDHDENYIERYQQLFEKVQETYNCKIPFLLKELLMITKHIDDETSNNANFSDHSYPVHWFNPIKSWEKVGNLLYINNKVDLALIPTGRQNNLIISKTGMRKVDLWGSIFRPFSSLFNIEGDSFPKYCKMNCGRQLAARITNVTSAPLALCLLENFTAHDISPQQITKVLNAISPQLWHDKDFLVRASKIYYKIGKEIPSTLLEDRQLCHRLVRSHGKMLKYCSKQFVQEDSEMVSDAARQNGFSIKYLSSQFLRSHPGVCELAVSSKPFSLDYVPKSVPGYRKLLIKGLKKIVAADTMHVIPKFVDDELLRDREIVELLLTNSPMLLEHMPKIWKDSKPLARRIVPLSPYCIQYFSPQVRQDPRILKMAIDIQPSLVFQLFSSTREQHEALFECLSIPFMTAQNYQQVLPQLLAKSDIYQVAMNLIENYPAAIKKTCCLTIFKQGYSRDVYILGSTSFRSIVPMLSLQEQEEVLQFVVNCEMKTTALPHSSYFSLFNRTLLKKYQLEACKKGISLLDAYTQLILVTNPEDIVQVYNSGLVNNYALGVCFTEEDYNSTKEMYPHYE